MGSLQALQLCSMEELEEMWVDVEELFAIKRKQVAVFEESALELEQERVVMVRLL